MAGLSSSEKLEKLRQKEKQLKAQIQLEQNRISTIARKERNGKLIAWGVAIEQLLQDESLKPEWWETQCRKVLTGKTLERALNQNNAQE